MIEVLEEHFGYLSHPLRLDRYRSAIEAVLRSGDRVVDAGCGTGVLGLLCLQAGASHVDLIDSSLALELARESLTRAGWEANVTFIHSTTFQATIPEQADLVVCDHVGCFGFDYGISALMADARLRLLKPGGTLIPRRISLYIGAVESAQCTALSDAWREASILPEFHWIRDRSVNTKHSVDLHAEDLLSAGAALGHIDFQVDNPNFFSWRAQLTILRDGVLNGLAGWFECELAAGISMTNSPLSDQAIGRAQAFLPIDEAIHVRRGDILNVTVMARPTDSLIAWTLEHPLSGKRFNQSTWRSEMFDRAELARSHPDYVPRLNRSADARSVVLSYCDGQRSVSQVQQAVMRDHPALFPSRDEISRFVISVLRRDTR